MKKQPHPSQNDIDALQGHDPKKVLFVSYDKNAPLVTDTSGKQHGDYDKMFEPADVGILGGNPTMYYLNSAKEGIHDPEVIIRTLKEHAKKYGTIDEVMISGHGNRNSIGQSAPLDTRWFLSELNQAENELGIKIANKIDFEGCEVFRELTPQDVALYKGYAKLLQVDIVAPTTELVTLSNMKGYIEGHYWEFTKEGGLQPVHPDQAVFYGRGQASHPERYDLKPEEVSKAEAWTHNFKPAPTPSKTQNSQLSSGEK
jgi:hypothetical protein